MEWNMKDWTFHSKEIIINYEKYLFKIERFVFDKHMCDNATNPFGARNCLKKIFHFTEIS